MSGVSVLKKSAVVLPAVELSRTPGTSWAARGVVVLVAAVLGFFLGGVVLAVLFALAAAFVAMQFGGPKKKAAKR